MTAAAYSGMLTAVVRLTYSDEREAVFGSGVVVSPNTVLTARHVVDPLGESLRGQLVNARASRIQGPAFDAGTVTVDEVRFPTDPGIDLALAIIHSPKKAPVDACCGVPAEPGAAVNVGDNVTMWGSSRPDGPMENDELRVQSVHGSAGVFVCNRAVPKGFSGGPVFCGGMLVGITYARNHDQGQTFFYSGHEIVQLLTQAVGEIRSAGSAGHILRRYPLGPVMPPNEVAARLSGFIDKCPRLFGAQQGRNTVARANQMRIVCGPDSGTKGLLEPAFFRDPAHDLYGFWFDAFMNAAAKSPRMLAALLIVIDDEVFGAEERAEKADVLARLERIGHT